MENRDEFLNKLRELYKDRYVSFDDLKMIKNDYDRELTGKADTRRWFWWKKRRNEVDLYLEEREYLNRKFIRREQKKEYSIEGNKLDPQQIEAVVACEDVALFLAPAGSGKSASLLAKVQYLIDVLGMAPERILVIAFTNKVVAELEERVKGLKVEIRTFHSLGNKILKGKYKRQKLLTEEQVEGLVRKIVQSLRDKNKEYDAKFWSYLRAGEPDDFIEMFENGDEESLTNLFIMTICLQKSERVDLEELKWRLKRISDTDKRKKALEYYMLYEPVARKYMQCLAGNHWYDFADMLNKATKVVENMKKGSIDYQYILVDEAQDLSTAKYMLLRAILEKCEKVKLFAVGDDWQSIYRFAGSNLRVLVDFEKIFERKTYRGLIELTYRFGQPTARISNRFIQKNMYQSRKKVKPHVKRRTPIEVRVSFEDDREGGRPRDYETLDKLFGELYREYGVLLFEKRVQIIARYNRDIYRIIDKEKKRYKKARLEEKDGLLEIVWKINGVDRELRVPFCSMHKAKGITRDIVIVINMNAGTMGMPALRENNPVTEVLLTKMDAYPLAEERRLFYVAMTRAKEKTVMVAEAERVSPFVFEVSPRLKGSRVKVCPKCHNGVLIEKRKKSDGRIMFRCTNEMGGCKFVK